MEEDLGYLSPVFDGPESRYSLCMYQVNGERLTLLDTAGNRFSRSSWTLEKGFYPRVDGNSQTVFYVTGAPYRNVSVVSWKDNQLTPEGTLKCVGECYSVGVISPHTLCVCDKASGSVSVVDVTDDTVTASLSKPQKVRDKKPDWTAVLGDSVVVGYEGDNLVVYENGVSSPGTMVTWPAGLQYARGVSSDAVSRFLVCDSNSNALLRLDARGKLCDKINNDTYRNVQDCTVVDGKIWVGCDDGDIVVLSPQ